MKTQVYFFAEKSLLLKVERHGTCSGHTSFIRCLKVTKDMVHLLSG